MGTIAALTRTLLLTAPFIVMAPGFARATGDIICEATDCSGASITVGIGHLPVLAILSATATDGARTWSTKPKADHIPIGIGQGFMDDRQVLIDFTGNAMRRVVVSLRLYRASGGKDYAEAGVLSFSGASAFPVQCING